MTGCLTAVTVAVSKHRTTRLTATDGERNAVHRSRHRWADKIAVFTDIRAERGPNRTGKRVSISSIVPRRSTHNGYQFEILLVAFGRRLFSDESSGLSRNRRTLIVSVSPLRSQTAHDNPYRLRRAVEQNVRGGGDDDDVSKRFGAKDRKSDCNVTMRSGRPPTRCRRDRAHILVACTHEHERDDRSAGRKGIVRRLRRARTAAF